LATALQQPCDEGQIRSGRCVHPCSPRQARWILLATILGSSMVFIDGSVVNLALPALLSEFGATMADAQWVVVSYLLFLSALLLVGGSLGDAYGRRKVFAMGTAIFAATSVWCGLAPNVAQLILARAGQGIGGALLVPGSLAILTASFPDETRGKAIGTWSGFSAIFAGLGPLLGGLVLAHFSWRWVFLINIPLAVAVLVILFRHVPESRGGSSEARIDWAGALLATAALGAIVYGLMESSERGFSRPATIASLVGGLLLFGVFLRVEHASAAPMMPLGLFRSRTFRGTNLLTLFLYAALSAALFFLPFNLIQVQRYNPAAAGAALLPFIVIISILSRRSGDLVARYGARRPLIIGPLIAGGGYLLFAVPEVGGSYWTTFFPAMAVLGLGMAVTVAPLTTAVMSSIPTAYAGIASGLNNAISRVAGLLAIAILGLFLSHSFDAALQRRIGVLRIPPEAARDLETQRGKLAGMQVPSTLDAGMRAATERAIAESYVAGFRSVMLASAGLALAAALCAYLLVAAETKPR
jgi:EmrB/QacA subfamily drug resistance transporter